MGCRRSRRTIRLVRFGRCRCLEILCSLKIVYVVHPSIEKRNGEYFQFDEGFGDPMTFEW